MLRILPLFGFVITRMQKYREDIKPRSIVISIICAAATAAAKEKKYEKDTHVLKGYISSPLQLGRACARAQLVRAKMHARALKLPIPIFLSHMMKV